MRRERAVFDLLIFLFIGKKHFNLHIRRNYVIILLAKFVKKIKK